mmetsp:Transcript_40681/g.91455  ORF Transcript_40681/g.91455 Transcript_40681/m.91455 type:complete len:243 (+) Transcript_40681:446-1174(+)
MRSCLLSCFPPSFPPCLKREFLELVRCGRKEAAVAYATAQLADQNAGGSEADSPSLKGRGRSHSVTSEKGGNLGQGGQGGQGGDPMATDLEPVAAGRRREERERQVAHVMLTLTLSGPFPPGCTPAAEFHPRLQHVARFFSREAWVSLAHAFERAAAACYALDHTLVLPKYVAAGLAVLKTRHCAAQAASDPNPPSRPFLDGRFPPQASELSGPGPGPGAKGFGEGPAAAAAGGDFFWGDVF